MVSVRTHLLYRPTPTLLVWHSYRSKHDTYPLDYLLSGVRACPSQHIILVALRSLFSPFRL